MRLTITDKTEHGCISPKALIDLSAQLSRQRTSQNNLTLAEMARACGILPPIHTRTCSSSASKPPSGSASTGQRPPERTPRETPPSNQRPSETDTDSSWRSAVHPHDGATSPHPTKSQTPSASTPQRSFSFSRKQPGPACLKAMEELGISFQTWSRHRDSMKPTALAMKRALWKRLRDSGLTLAQIGVETGFSHTSVSYGIGRVIPQGAEGESASTVE